MADPTPEALALCVTVGSGAHRLGMECASCREIQAVLTAQAREIERLNAERDALRSYILCSLPENPVITT